MATSKQAKTKPGSTQSKAQANGGANGQRSAGRSAQRPAQAPARQAQARQAQARQTQTRKARDRARARELALQQAVAEPEQNGPPLWLRITTFVLAIFGLGVSVYLTIEHFTGNTTLACSDKGLVNCSAVTTSPESMVFGVFPVAVLGLAFYVFAVAIMSPWAWRSGRREIALARLASLVVGIGFALYLIYVELFQVGAICLWCTSVHVVTFALFVLVAMSAAVWGLPHGDARRAR